MDGVTESTTSKKRGHVTLTTHDALQDDDRVVVGEHVVSSAAKRSQLLSGISDTQGRASLPTSISAEDVRLWQTACVVQSDMSSGELCKVLKVAHALGDTDTGAWMCSLADNIEKTKWQDEVECNAVLSGLLLLPHDVLVEVCAACMRDDDARVERFLYTLPACLHRPFLCAAATGTGADLHVPEEPDSARLLLTALASQPLPPPGLRTLRTAIFAYFESAVPTAMAALLARAACTQTSLTSLCLGELHMPPDSLCTFGAALALSPPPRLAELSICTDAHPGGVAALAECLRPLARLTSLEATIHLSEAGGATTPLDTFNRLAASPAVLPQLQRMVLEEYARDEAGIPTHSHGKSCFSMLLGLLSTTALESVSLATSARAADHLGAALGRLKSVRTLQLRVKYPGSLGCYFGNELADIHLPSLEDVSIESHCPLLVLALPAALPTATAASLTSLTIKIDSLSKTPARPHEALATWRCFWSSISMCNQLRQLHLNALCHYSTDPEFNEHLCALSSLTQLTSLRLRADGALSTRTVLKADSFFSTLQTLPQLRSVHLCSGGNRLTFDSVPTALAELARMHVLEELGMAFHGVTLSDAAALLPRLPALRRLGLHDLLFNGPEEEDPARSAYYDVRKDFQAQFPGVNISCLW